MAPCQFRWRRRSSAVSDGLDEEVWEFVAAGRSEAELLEEDMDEEDEESVGA